MYINNLSDQFFVAFEHDNLVCACSAHQPHWIGFTRTFAKDFNSATYQTFTRAACRFVDNLEQILIALLFDVLIDLIRHFRGGRLAARRIAKNERVIELEFFNQIARMPVIVVGFARKSHDDIGGNRDTLACVPDAANKIDIFLRRVG